jgi:hypothetical protein
MYLEYDCTSIDKSLWDKLMKGAKPINYKWLISKIRKHIPDLYKDLALDFYNPYSEQCVKTKTHYVLVSSAIEYFIRK